MIWIVPVFYDFSIPQERLLLKQRKAAGEKRGNKNRRVL